MDASSSKRRRVVVVFAKEHCSGHIINGILRNRHARRDWTVEVHETDCLAADALRLTPDYCDGVIGDLCYHGYPNLVRHLAVPAVFVHGDLSRVRVPRRVPAYGFIAIDNYELIECAADYLVPRGFTSFAFAGTASRVWWSDERAVAAKHVFSRRGFMRHVFSGTSGMVRSFAAAERRLAA